jgi:hypothetical protein
VLPTEFKDGMIVADQWARFAAIEEGPAIGDLVALVQAGGWQIGEIVEAAVNGSVGELLAVEDPEEYRHRWLVGL